MVKWRYAVLTAVGMGAIIAVIGCYQSEEGRIKKRFDLLAEWVSKKSGENPFTMARKLQNIGTLFAEECGIEAPFHAISGSFTRDEISSHAARARLPFSELALQFHDFSISFPEERTAAVTLTGRVRGRSSNGEYFNEIRELHCILKKVADTWLFNHIEVIEVLKR